MRTKFQKEYDKQLRERAQELDLKNMEAETERARCEIAMLEAERKILKIRLERMELDVAMMRMRCKKSAKR